AANVFVVLFDRDELKLTVNRATMAVCFLLTGANAWFVYNVARRLWTLRATKELGDRGHIGFITDTVGSLIDTYFYNQPYHPYLQLQPSTMKPSLTLVLVGTFLLSVIVLAYHTVKQRRFLFTGVLLLVVALAVAVPVTEHEILAIDYPTGRIALYYVPLAAAFGMFFIDECVSWSKGRIGALCQFTAIFLTAVMLLHLFRTANLKHTLTWFYD